MTRHLWTVPNPESDLTVIAETAEEAVQIAIESSLLEPEDYAEARDGVCPAPVVALRWVGVESETDLYAVRMELDRARVDPALVRLRTLCDGYGRPLLWEIGAPDSEWVKLPAGVLCGGAS